ncbi:hypothetical protein VTK26DRAFT_1536 [Humicola hyalothermophila]
MLASQAISFIMCLGVAAAVVLPSSSLPEQSLTRSLERRCEWPDHTWICCCNENGCTNSADCCANGTCCNIRWECGAWGRAAS